MSRIVAISDLHIDYSRRFKDTLDVMKQILDFAILKKANYLMIAGDIYQYKRPRNVERHAFETWVLRFVENKIKVVMIPGLKGKHDFDKNISVVDEFNNLNIQGVQVLNNGDIFITRDNIRVKLWHILVREAKLGALGYSLASAQNISIQAILATNKGISGADVILLGHIHKAQILYKENPLITYIGSIDHIDFAERNEHKYLLYIDITKDKENILHNQYKFYRLKTRPMKQFDIRTVEELKNVDINGVSEAIVKVVFHCKKEDKDKFDWQLIQQKFNGAYTYTVHYDYIKHKRVRNRNINERISPVQAFLQYGKEKKLEQRVIKRGLEIIEEKV